MRAGETDRTFRALQERLPAAMAGASRGATVTVVVVPSFSSDPDLVRREPALRYWEHRMLDTLGALRDESVRVVFVTSHELSPAAVRYALDLHVPAAATAFDRLTLVVCDERTEGTLAAGLLRRPEVVARIRAASERTELAYIECYAATELERALAIELALPLHAADPVLSRLGRKSESRRLMRGLGIPVPEGIEGVRGVDALARALSQLKTDDPGLHSAVVKLDDSVGGVGNAVFRYDVLGGATPTAGAIGAQLPGRLELALPILDRVTFLERVEHEGCVVERLLDGGGLRSPSVQCTIDLDGAVSVEATHDQVLTGVLGQHFAGCWFPATDGMLVHDAAAAVGRRLAAQGAIGWFGVDFLTFDGPDGRRLCGLEVNLRRVGTVHHLATLRNLVGGAYREASGEFVADDGRSRVYYGTDSVVVPGLAGVEVVDVLRRCAEAPWRYRSSSGTGVVLHMLDAVVPYGRLGLTCIGRTRAEAGALLDDATTDLTRLAGHRDPRVDASAAPRRTG